MVYDVKRSIELRCFFDHRCYIHLWWSRLIHLVISPPGLYDLWQSTWSSHLACTPQCSPPSAPALSENDKVDNSCQRASNHLKVVFFMIGLGNHRNGFFVSICEIFCHQYPQDQDYLEKSFLRQAPWTWAGREGGSTARSSRPPPPCRKKTSTSDNILSG